MPCNHIYLENGQKKAYIVQNEQEYRSLRNTPEQVANLQKARQGDQSAKMRLVQFNYSGHFPNGIVKGTKLPSAAFGFDIDDPETFEQVAQRLLANPDEYGLLMLERSASQGGHAVFVREKGKTILENQVRIATQLQCEMDTNAHDINRVYFASTDSPEELLYISPKLFEDVYDEAEVAEEAKVLETRIEDLPEDAHKANKHYKPWEEQHSTPLSRERGDGGESGESLSYQGIPYREIIAKWWELYNDGKEPVKSNRDVLTFELAVNLRHICGFDRVLMDKIIPCYDEFPQQQKMKCIDSALAERRTQMPARLKNVLQSLRKDHIFDQSVQNAIDEINLEDDMYYYNNLPLAALPQGVIDSVKAVGETKVMPVILAIAPMIGMLATKVRLMIHDRPTGLNLITYLCGKAGSGKGSIDDLVKNWMYEITLQDDMYHQQEREYRERKQRAKNAN